MNKAPNWQQPTSEQCTAEAVLWEDGDCVARAIWYPQIGGYSSHAVVLLDRRNPEGCFEALVWSDGEFPIHAHDVDPPAPMWLHHCSANQFIEFGQSILSWGMKESDA